MLTLAINSMLNKQIAAELGVSEITVKVHRRRVMEKMQVRSRGGAGQEPLSARPTANLRSNLSPSA